MRRSFCVTFAICLICAFSAGLAAENWPQWRGPGGQGISTEKQLPTEWSPATNVAWKVELPHGYSSPIVWEQTAYEGPVFDARHQRSTFAGPTAVTDGKMVYAYFGPEGLFAYDTSGKLAWKMVEKFHTAGLGAGTSPILHENLVILQRDEDNETSVVVAYDKTSGKEVWKTKRPVQISWSTPVIVTAGSRTELVTNGSEHVISYDPATGKELWKTTGVQSNAIHTPLVGKGLVIVTAGSIGK